MTEARPTCLKVFGAGPQNQLALLSVFPLSATGLPRDLRLCPGLDKTRLDYIKVYFVMTK